MVMCLSSGWVRYPDHLVRNAVDVLVDLLSLCVRSEIQESYSIGNPVLSLALLDPQSLWFRKWMHTTLSRKKLVSALKSEPAFLRYIVRVALYSEADAGGSGHFPQASDINDTGIVAYSWNEKKRAILTFSIRTLCLVLKYSESQILLFPVELFENSTSKFGAPACLSKLIQRRLCDEESPIPVAVTARRCILELSTEKRKAQSILFQWEVVEQICSAIASKRVRREAKLTAVQVLLNLFKTKELHANLLSSYSTFVVDHCSSLLRLGAEKDPSLPHHTFIMASIDLCKQLLCNWQAKEQMKKKKLSADLTNFVKERNMEPEIMFPFLVAFDLPDDSVKRHRRNMFLSASLSYLQVPVEIGPTVFDCFVKRADHFIKTFNKPSTQKSIENYISPSEVDFFDGGKLCVPFLAPIICVVLSNPDMAWSCVKNDTFVEFVEEIFAEVGQDPSIAVDAALRLLSLLSCNLNFATAFEMELKLSRRIKHILQNHCTKGREKDFLIMSQLSIALVQLFLRLKMIGGPKERDLKKIVTDRFPSSLSELVEKFVAYFYAEPSRSVIKRIVPQMQDLPDKQDLISYYFDCLASRQRPPYCEIMLKYLQDLEFDIGQSTKVSRDNTDWSLVIDFVNGMKLLKETDEKSLESELNRIAQDAPYIVESSANGIDWLLVAYALMVEMNQSATAASKIKRLAACSHAKTFWPYLVGNNAHSKAVMDLILPLMEKLIEAKLPRVKAALSVAGIPLISLLFFWINQSFFNVLDSNEVFNYVTMSVVGGWKYQCVFMTAVLKHMEDDICKSVNNGLFPSVLFCGNASRSFRLYTMINFLKNLEDKLWN